MQSTDPSLSAFVDDLRRVIPDFLPLDWEILSGSTPHGVLLLGGAESEEAALQEARQTAIDLAHNYRFFVESRASAAPPRAGIIVSAHFPTLSLNWETHPYEDIPQTHGLWKQPFADLGDVVEAIADGDRVSLRLSEHAVQRIDACATLQGHRRFFIRMVGLLEETSPLGPYTWMPGLRHIPGLPSTVTVSSASGSAQRVSIDRLRQEFATRIAAQKRVEKHVASGVDSVWTTAPIKSHYREPFMLWVTQGEDWNDESPFYAPWIETAEQPRRWVALRAGAVEEISAPLPPSWQLTTGPSDSDSLIFTGDPSAADAVGFQAFLRRHLGRDVALLMEGEVIGIIAVDSAHPEQLVLSDHTPTQRTRIVSRWEAAHGNTLSPTLPDEMKKTELGLSDPSPTRDLDFFQVRLMAEPQDRELIPVTHFAAPGTKQGVLVAVQNDVILNSHDIAGARLETKANRIFLHLDLTGEGKDALSGTCFSNLGKQLAIIYEDRLLCAPTIVDWELEELSFKGMDDDWPDVAKTLADRLGK